MKASIILLSNVVKLLEVVDFVCGNGLFAGLCLNVFRYKIINPPGGGFIVDSPKCIEMFILFFLLSHTKVFISWLQHNF